MKSLIRIIAGIGLSLCLIIGCIPLNAVNAEADNIAPVLNSFRILDGDVQEDGSIKVMAGDSLNVEVDITEENTGIRHMVIHFNDINTGTPGYMDAVMTELPTLYTGKHTVRFEIPQGTQTAKYRITAFYIDDNAYNTQMLYYYEGDPEYDIILDIEGRNDNSPVLTGARLVESIDNPVPVVDSYSFKVGDTITYELEGNNIKDNDDYLLQLYALASSNSNFLNEGKIVKRNDKYYISFEATGKLAGDMWEIQLIGIINGIKSSYYSFTAYPYKDDMGNWVKEDSLTGYNGPDDWFSIEGKTALGVIDPSADERAMPELVSVSSVGTVSRPGILTVAVHFKSSEAIKKVNVNCYSITNHSYSRGDFTFDSPVNEGTAYINLPIEITDELGEWFIKGVDLEDSYDRTYGFGANEYTDYELLYSVYKNGNFINHVSTGISHLFTVTDDKDYDIELGLTNPKIYSILSQMQEGSVIRIPITETESVLPAKVFEAIRGRDITLVCYDTNRNYAYQWIINGKDINKKSKDVDLRVSYSKENGSDLGLDDDYIKMTFAPNGELPGKANIRLKSDYINNQWGVGKNYYLYFIDEKPDYNDLIRQSSGVELVISGEDKWCTFDITHNSLYIVTSGKPKATITSESVTGVNSSYTYNGSYIKPLVTVDIKYKVGKKEYVTRLSSATDYTVSYSNNKAVGEATITISGKGSISGSTQKHFFIIPKGTSISKLSGGSKSFKAYWKKQSTSTTGYLIQYSTSNTMSKAKSIRLSKNTSTSRTISNLAKKKKYYVRIRTYRTVGSKNYYSGWSAVKTVKTK